MGFYLTAATKVTMQWASEPIRRAAARFARDLAATLEPGAVTEVQICLNAAIPPEQYTIDVQDDRRLVVCSSDDLGAVYALLHLSERWLGVAPFWVWNGQRFARRPRAEITQPHEGSRPAPVRYRGWSLADAVLLARWNGGISQEFVWEMLLEALLRCGGNLVVPPRGAAAESCAALAVGMGLWLGQPRGCPLGIPPEDAAPGYRHFPEETRARWAAAIARQKNRRTVWQLGFPALDAEPGAGDAARKGALLSEILRDQFRMIRAALPDAPVVVPLFGEALALFRAGQLTLPRDVVRLWMDDGSGSGLARPQAGAPLPAALPPVQEQGGGYRHGLFMPLSNHNGRTGCHLTMTPLPMERLQAGLSGAWHLGVSELWLFRVDDLKPQLYPAALAGGLWLAPDTGVPALRDGYLRRTYGGAAAPEAEAAPDAPAASAALTEGELAALASCLEAWPEATVALGGAAEAHGGEEFINVSTRILANRWLLGLDSPAAPPLRWATGDIPFAGQVAWYRGRCAASLARMEPLWEQCEAMADAAGRLWRDGLLLQVRVYALCLHGAVTFCDAWVRWAERDDRESFFLLGNAADDYTAADKALRECEHDAWSGFYANDCLTEIKLTARLLRGLMALVRARGEGPFYNDWQRAERTASGDPVCRLRDDELYLLMARRRAGGANPAN